jgi:hypothetical protein
LTGTEAADSIAERASARTVAMRATRVTLLAGLLTALIFATGQALAAIPNVEAVTFLSFVSGYLLGPWVGMLVGAGGMGAHSLFNVLGAAPPPVWLAQATCYGAIGCAGAFAGPVVVRLRSRAAAMAASAGTGAAAVFVYQLVVNTVSFMTFASGVPLWTYVWGGVAFGAVQLAWNAVLFGTVLPPTLRVLARHRRELVGR